MTVFLVVFWLVLLGFGLLKFDQTYGAEKICILGNNKNSGGLTTQKPVCGKKLTTRDYKAKLVDGKAIAPVLAPARVKQAIAAANRIRHKPYVYGGGHGSFESSGYDCSGAVSYALRGGKFLSSPLSSGPLMSWGNSGKGKWITVYSHSGHAFIVIAGLRFDTSGTGGSGPRWHSSIGSTSGFTTRYPENF
jgi:cell wall-associated NlpC family hydrolase